MFKGCFNVGPCKRVMPYTVSPPYKLSQHWPLTSTACHSALFWWDLWNRDRSSLYRLKRWTGIPVSTVTSFFVGFERKYRWRGFFLIKIRGFFFFKSNQNGESYMRSKPGNLSKTCRHLSTSRWAAGLSCVRFTGKSKLCTMKAFDSWQKELPSCSTDPQQPRLVSHQSEHNTSCVWHHVLGVT